jgi:hypothetical protein
MVLSAQRETGGSDVGSPEQLNGHQRDTLAQVFRHPTSHNIEWHSILSLLNSVGAVQETNKGHLVVTVEGETETFEPRHKDIDTEQLANLRRLLKKAGYGPEEVPA